MKIAVFGKSGKLSQALKKLVLSGTHDAVFYRREDCDLAGKPDDIRKFVTEMPKADVVVIAAAYTDVARAENDAQTAFAVNAIAPAIIAETCADRDIFLIYISTDYVFDGMESKPYEPDQAPNPLNVYGLSKRAGEIAVINSGVDFAILRTSWLFDGKGRNFLTTMLKLGATDKRIQIVGDQIGRPTYVGHLAEAVISVAENMSNEAPFSSGVFHVTNTGKPVSWAGFAREIFKKTEDKLGAPVVVDEILTKDYAKKVARPAYSVLDTSTFERTFKLALPDWREGLELALTEWRQKAE